MNKLTHPYPVVDAHIHFMPAKAELIRQVMESNGISYVVNLDILGIEDIPFDEGFCSLRQTLGDRMIFFCAPDFGDTAPGFGERFAQDLERKVAAGVQGLKIYKELGLRHRDHQGKLIPVEDQRLDPLWAKAGELGIPVLIHTGDPIAFFQPLDENNERLDELQAHPYWYFGGPEFPSHDTLLEQRNRVIERHTHTTFIGAHLGNYPENLDYVSDCLDRYPNFYVDTSARISEFGRHPVEQTRAFFIKHQDRILFGSDLVLGWQALDDRDMQNQTGIQAFYAAHWRFYETDDRQINHPFPIQGNWKVDAINLPAAVLEKLYYQNAQRIIPGIGEIE